MKMHAVIIAFTVLITFICAFSFDYTENNRWLATSIPVPYEINTSGAPGSSVNAIQNAFNTWQNASNDFISFSYTGTSGRGVSEDNHDVLCWGYAYGAIAYAIKYSSYPITEADICFSDSYSWSTSTPPATGCFDVQNIATHEGGHWLRMKDLYGGSDSEKTMYGYSTAEETKKKNITYRRYTRGIIYLFEN